MDSAATPILDRRAPLPAPVEPSVSRNLLVKVIAPAIGAGLGLLGARALIAPPRLSTSFDVMLLAVWLVPVMLAIVSIHEAGHAAVALSTGLRVSFLHVGPVQIDGRFRISRYRGPGQWFDGAVASVPVGAHRLRARGIAVTLGGPAANLLSAWLWLWLAAPTAPLSRLFIAISLISGLGNLVPFRIGAGASDGWYLMKAMKRGWMERWLALRKLDAEIAAGGLPESWPDDFLSTATACRDDSADTFRAHGLAHAAFDARGDWDAAARALEVCLQHCSHESPTAREAVFSDAAVFQGRRRGRADLAQQWLDEFPDPPEFPEARALAEAAVLEASGDLRGALAKLKDVESSLQAGPAGEARKWMASISPS